MSLLRLESVTTSYWRGSQRTRVLRDVSLAVEPAKLVAVYGERNSGKTALLRIAGGFEQPDAGCVTFAGQDLSIVAPGRLAAIQREEIGWVDRAGPRSAELDVGTYVALPLYGRLGRRRAHRRAVEVLAAIGVEGATDQRWADLPDIARVLCAIVHATIGTPQLLLADDPTAGLGILDRERVCGTLRQLSEQNGMGILMVVPDMPSMLHAHHVHLLSRGRLLAPTPGSEDQLII